MQLFHWAVHMLMSVVKRRKLPTDISGDIFLKCLLDIVAPPLRIQMIAASLESFELLADHSRTTAQRGQCRLTRNILKTITVEIAVTL